MKFLSEGRGVMTARERCNDGNCNGTRTMAFQRHGDVSDDGLFSRQRNNHD